MILQAIYKKLLALAPTKRAAGPHSPERLYRSSRRYGGLLLLPFLVSGCSLRLNEEVVKNQITVNPVQSGCLSNSGPLFDRYFKGESKEEEVQAYWLCLEKAINTFTENTRGASSEHFTGDELASFLSKYFMKGKIINPALVQEAMLLKQGILGGSAEKITQKELKQTLELIRALRKVSLRLRPHMPVRVDSYLERKYTADQFEAAMIDFQEGLSEVGKTLEQSQGSYSFDRLASLIREFKLYLYTDPNDGAWLDTALRWTTALRPAKHIFIAPPKDEIRDSDWAKIYFLAPRYYGLYMRTVFYAKTNKDQYVNGEGLARLEKLFSDTTELLGKVLENHPEGVIHSAEVKELLEALKANDMLPVPVDTAQAFIRTVFGRLFASNSLQDSYTITKANLDRVTESFRFGTEGLRAIEAAFQKIGQEEITAQQLAHINNEDLLEATALKNDLSREAILALKKSAAEVRTIFPKKSTVVYVPEKAPLEKFSAGHLAKIHLMYTMNRLLLQAYGAQKTSLTEAEVGVLADDIFPMLQGLGLVSPETRKSVSKRLFEASLFLYSSDGDTGVTMTEAMEVQSLLLSTIIRGRLLHADIAQKCNATEKDELGRVLIEPKCYRKKFIENHSAVWAYIPGLAKYFGAKDKKDQEKIIAQMERFLRKDRVEQPFNPSDSYSFILLPYYVELLFSRFDADRNGLLENKEAEAAFPVFQPFLATKAAAHGLTSKDDHYAVYMFLLAYQDLPNNMKMTWIWRRYVTGAKNFKADRGQVIQIFEKLLSQ
jgi:hypothetical protein